MRNLTIKRIKSYVGSLSKMKVYVENPESGELTINNTPCSRLGELKNGEEKTFQIDDRAQKVYVIADRLSKGYCNEYYQLPEGQEDVYLTGKNRFNPANGNAFRFENNDNEAVAANRRRDARKGLLVLIICTLIGALLGYLIGHSLVRGTPREKTFSSNGMTITLTNGFRETDVEGYTVVYDSKDAAVFALKEPFTLAEGFGDYTLDQYADLIIRANGLRPDQKKTVDGQTCIAYDYTNPENNKEYHYDTYVYKTGDAFWAVQFVTSTKDAGRYAEKFAQWAKTVTFDR